MCNFFRKSENYCTGLEKSSGLTLDDRGYQSYALLVKVIGHMQNGMYTTTESPIKGLGYPLISKKINT